MRKKLLTVCWSATVAVEVPDTISDEQLVEADFRSPTEVQELAVQSIKYAYDNIQARDGQITDIQDA